MAFPERQRDPTPAEIAQRCREIQADWSPGDFHTRWRGKRAVSWTVPEIPADCEYDGQEEAYHPRD